MHIRQTMWVASEGGFLQGFPLGHHLLLLRLLDQLHFLQFHLLQLPLHLELLPLRLELDVPPQLESQQQQERSEYSNHHHHD
jgi:hypothetical protein